MRNIIAIWRRETLSFFVSPIAYFAIAGLVLIGAYFFFNLLAIYNFVLGQIAQMPYGAPQAPSINQFIVEQYFQTLLVILVMLTPLLTMRIIAEERRRGTFELLLTSPISVADIVIGKFLGLATLVTAMVFAASLFPLGLVMFFTVEVGPLLCGILGLWLFALSFAAVGMAASSFTENQIVAAVCSIVVLLLLYMINAPAESLGGSALAAALNYMSPPAQAQEMMRGVLSTKSVFYFISLTGAGLFFSFRALEAQRWR